MHTDWLSIALGPGRRLEPLYLERLPAADSRLGPSAYPLVVWAGWRVFTMEPAIPRTDVICKPIHLAAGAPTVPYF